MSSNQFSGVEKVVFDILDNIFQYRVGEIYVQDSSEFQDGYCIRNYNRDVDDNTTDEEKERLYHFSIDISKNKVKINISKINFNLHFLTISTAYGGLGNKSKKKIEEVDKDIKSGSILYSHLDPSLFEYFENHIINKYKEYKECQMKDYEYSIYNILGIERQTKIKKIMPNECD